MGSTMCKQQENYNPTPGAKRKENKLVLIGDILNPSTRAIILCLKIGQLEFEHRPIDLIARENRSAEFLALHPSGQTPVLEDNGAFIYGGGLVAMRHITQKYVDVDSSLKMSEYFEQINVLFGNLEHRIAPLTRKIQRMILEPAIASASCIKGVEVKSSGVPKTAL